MLYLNLPIKKFVLFIFYILLLLSQAYTQEIEEENNFEQQINSDSLNQPFWPNIIRSAVYPGLGQITQERPEKAAVFYGISGSLVYNAAFNYYWYHKTKNSKYYNRFRKFAILYSQVYIINMIDVVTTQISGENLTWQAEMFSDQPLKSPWGAAVRSAMIPGWGQVYNEQYIKSVIVFGIVMDFIRKAVISNERYKKTGSKSQLERRTVNTWYAGLTYTLNMVDAFVDAYLYKFDETMELGFNVVPLGQNIGLSLTLTF